jgi:hypothetical protein
MSNPSIPESQTQEITKQIASQTQEITKQIARLVEQAKEIEWKYLLRLTLSNRHGGCGYRYLFGDELEIVYGNVDIITLSDVEDNCTRTREVLIVPKTIPAIVEVYHWDEDPQVENYIEFFIFTENGWVKVVSNAPPQDEQDDPR